MSLTMTWRSHRDLIFGDAWEIVDIPIAQVGEAHIASAYKRGDGTWHAHAFIKGRYLSHCGSAAKTAMRRLQKEIDRRSIDLFGEDVVWFVGGPAAERIQS